MNTVELIEAKLEEFGLENINENTTVFVDKKDHQDVQVENSDFDAFTKVHSIGAYSLVDYDDDVPVVNRDCVEGFVSGIVEA